MADDECEVVEEIRLPEVDCGTRIDRMADGSLRLRMDLMPPAWAREDQHFDSFQDDLERAIGTPVEGLDKELFAIRAPWPNTIDTIRRFLVELRRQGQGRVPPV